MKTNNSYLDKIEIFFDTYKKEIGSSESEFVLCWSGGKDSTALLFLLAELQKKKPFQLKVIMVPYPKATINYDGLDETIDYWHTRNIKINILDHQYPDPANIATSKVCPECKRIRRLVLTEEFFNHVDLKNTTIITGHNSWDLAAYLIEMVVADIVKVPKIDEFRMKERYLEVTNKFFPYYQAPFGPTIIRPFINFEDSDVECVINDNDIPYPFSFIPDKCPWLEQRKRILHNYFKTMNLKLHPEKIIHLAKEMFDLPEKEEFDSLPFQTYIL